MTTQRRRRLEIEDIGDVTIVNFTDKKILDEQNIQTIGEELYELVDKKGRKKILLCFSNIEYFSTAAFGKLIVFNKKVTAAGGRLIMCGMYHEIFEAFEISKLNKLFEIHPKEGSVDALKLFT